MISIEKNVPMPQNGAGRAGKYPFADMDVGDSFALPKTDKAAKQISSRARSWAVGKGLKDRKFSTRTNGETVRIWRTA